MAESKGFLAIWSDIAPTEQTDYLHWLTREHTAERVGIPGFLAVRVFRARMEGVCRYFILYELESSTVVKSGAYLARLNSPTAWSQRIMPRLQNFVRGGGRILAEAGAGQGSVILPLVLEASEKGIAKEMLQSLSAIDEVVAVRLLEVDEDATTIRTSEKSMRTKDKSFAVLLLMEGLREDALHTALDRIGKQRVQEPPIVYDQIFALDKRSIL
jgi:hypothetical protein